MMKLFKNVMILIGIIISFSIYEFLCHDGTLDFYVILKRSIILAIIGIILLLVIEMIKYFKKRKKENKQFPNKND